MKIGLRIDVDTFRGTKIGVPNLVELLCRYGAGGTFFFSVGPDNMGRHLRRLLRPTFLWKMLRSRAGSLYGWDILLRGTLGEGPIIGKKLGHVIRAVAAAGFEIGLHAWDHYTWQSRIDNMAEEEVFLAISRGLEMLEEILAQPVQCSAVPGWRCPEKVLLVKERFPFLYNSDCRGESIFYPVVAGRQLAQMQIPVTLPTYDEVIGRNGISAINYNEHLLSLCSPDRCNVLTIHAEVEGIFCRDMFEEFLLKAKEKDIDFVPLKVLPVLEADIGQGEIVYREIPGREGVVACQAD